MFSNGLRKMRLHIYNTKSNEPVSSVMESLDYEFAIERYPETDFRYLFSQAYIKYIQQSQGITVFNCKFERPGNDADFINFHIYLWEGDPDINYRIEDAGHPYVQGFYKILETYKLPGLTKKTKVQFFINNIETVIYAKAASLAWQDIHNKIKDDFSEVEDLSFWSGFYVFIRKEQFNSIIADKGSLDRIKKYCYEATKKHDVNNVLDFKRFHIRVDNYQIYEEIGGQHYFNSDYMSECLFY